MASVTPGPALALSAPTKREAVRRHLCAVSHPPLLEVDRPLAPFSGSLMTTRGLAAVVAGRQQPRAGLPPVAQRLGHL
jgi:hypothetical protein